MALRSATRPVTKIGNNSMRSLTNPWKSYQQVATQTAPPGQLVLMLYEGAIRFLERALSGFDIEDPAERNQTINNNIIRTQDIVFELNVTLNIEQGGELAMTLRRLYDYMDRRLMESNLKKDVNGVKEVTGRIRVLRDAWAQMLANQGQNLPALAVTDEPKRGVLAAA
jgi:flagellar protein FliS